MPWILIKTWSEFLNPKVMDRRHFIHRVVRGGVLAALAVLTGILFARQQVTLQGECSDNFQCKNCSKLSRCTLPEADKIREYGEEG